LAQVIGEIDKLEAKFGAIVVHWSESGVLFIHFNPRVVQLNQASVTEQCVMERFEDRPLMTLENHQHSDVLNGNVDQNSVPQVQQTFRQTTEYALGQKMTSSAPGNDVSRWEVGVMKTSANSAGSGELMSECDESWSILARIKAGEVLMVNSRRRNGLILYKEFHAEFAGPGAAVGSEFDLDCQHVIPVGNISLLEPETYDDCQRAFKIRRQWIKLTQQFTDQPQPLQRAQMILNQFEAYFDPKTIANIPDEAFARLVGVLPHTIRSARRPPGQVAVKVRT
jgi:hypothetical protein